MGWISDPQAWIALATLTALEIVLGMDNIIFISILVGRLEERQRDRARILGLAVAMLSRILLLTCLSWIMSLKTTLFVAGGREFSWRSLILIFGGLFLMAKSTHEIHGSLEGPGEGKFGGKGVGLVTVLVQISLLDIIFSLDSVITAVGLAEHLPVMILAIMVSVGIMMFSANAIGNFVDSHPTIKMLALSFLIMIGVALFGEGFGLHIPKGYIYFAMAFSVSVEMLNLKVRAKTMRPVKLHKSTRRELPPRLSP